MHGHCPRKRSREAAGGASNNAPTPKITAAVTDVATQSHDAQRRSRPTSTTTSGDALMPKPRSRRQSKPRSRRQSSQTSSGVRVKRRSDMKLWCAADMHAPESWGKDRWNTFIGAVIAADTAPREAGNKKVFNVVLEDTTGLVSMAAWHHHAEVLASMTTQLEDAKAQSGHEYLLRVDLFSIKQMKGASRALCPICLLHTIGRQVGRHVTGAAHSSGDLGVVDSSLGTRFTLVRASDVHTPNPSRSPSSRVGIGGITKGITNFAALKQMHPPFRVNLAGVITKVTGLQPTSRDDNLLLRHIELTDEHGNQVTIKQLVNADGGAEVHKHRKGVAYFVCGTKARDNDEAGSLWAHEDSVIKVTSSEPVVHSHAHGCIGTHIHILPY